MRRSDVLFSAIQITNNYAYPVSLYLGSGTGDGKRYAVMHVDPGQSTALSAPVGVYGVSFEHGQHWCGDGTGYFDGEKITLNQRFHNEPGKTGKIVIGRTGRGGPSVAYSYSTPEPAPPIFAVTGSGSVDLRQDADGHYRVNGSVSGTSVQFMLDTGATITSVSNDFALRARIPSCVPTTTNTANGVTNSCLARVPDLSFGNFKVTDVDVIILPRLTGSEALLGMNVLGRFGIEQRGGNMRISAP
jgi:clan AA aspartic protease (TIGR02281 family)